MLPCSTQKLSASPALRHLLVLLGSQSTRESGSARAAHAAMADQPSEPTEIELKVAVRLGTQRMLARFQEFFDIEADLFELYVQTNILAPRRAPELESNAREARPLGDVPTDAPDDVDEEALDEEIRELALRLRRANEELASLEPAVDPEPVAKKLREIQEGRDGVLEKARYDTWHTELKGMEERCWELVRAFRNPPES